MLISRENYTLLHIWGDHEGNSYNECMLISGMLITRVDCISNQCPLRMEVKVGEIGLYSGSIVNTGCMGYEEKVTMGRSIGCANSFEPGPLSG